MLHETIAAPGRTVRPLPANNGSGVKAVRKETVQKQGSQSKPRMQQGCDACWGGALLLLLQLHAAADQYVFSPHQSLPLRLLLPVPPQVQAAHSALAAGTRYAQAAGP